MFATESWLHMSYFHHMLLVMLLWLQLSHFCILATRVSNHARRKFIIIGSCPGGPWTEVSNDNSAGTSNKLFPGIISWIFFSIVSPVSKICAFFLGKFPLYTITWSDLSVFMCRLICFKSLLNYDMTTTSPYHSSILRYREHSRNLYPSPLYVDRYTCHVSCSWTTSTYLLMGWCKNFPAIQCLTVQLLSNTPFSFLACQTSQFYNCVLETSVLRNYNKMTLSWEVVITLEKTDRDK